MHLIFLFFFYLVFFSLSIPTLKGAFGAILRSKRNGFGNGKTLAIKVSIEADSDLEIEHAILSVRPLNEHPNSIKYYGSLQSTNSDIKFITQKPNGDIKRYIVKRGLVMEFVENDLNKALHHNGNGEVHRQKLNVVKGIAKGMEAVHKANYLHKDMKPQNIMLAVDTNGTVVPKIMDYGAGT